MIHSLSDVQSNSIGSGSSVWQFCVILPGAIIGSNCNICSHCFVENDVVVGDNVTIKCGVQIWDGMRIESNVFIGPNVTFSNDKYPRSKQYPEKYASTHVCEGASIGAGAVICPGITIGAHSLIGAGATVTRDVPPYALVMGNPARIVRYLNEENNRDS